MSEDLKAINQEIQAIWDKKADFWNDLMSGDGNLFHSTLVRPSVERLLQVQPGEYILDIACGNGVFTRQLAQLGAKVLATDFSSRFIELARAQNAEYEDSIEYSQVDATSEEQLLALGERKFDAAVCTMAMQDISTLEPMLNGLARLLKPEGRFVFAIPHPVFNATSNRMSVEQEDRDGQLVVNYFIKIKDYLNPQIAKGTGAPGEPAAHYYFDRPLHSILNSCFQTGFMMDGIEEPTFTQEAQPNRPFSWTNYQNFPPVLAVRLRLAAK